MLPPDTTISNADGECFLPSRAVLCERYRAALRRMDFEIREATLGDRETIAEFNSAMAMETEQKALDPAVLGDGVRRLLEDPGRGTYYLAVHQGRIIGQLMYTREWSDWRNGWFWWIQSVYVDPAHRGRSVFSTLYKHLHSLACADEDVCGIRLYVDSDNQLAQEVYRSLGMTLGGYRVMETIVR